MLLFHGREYFANGRDTKWRQTTTLLFKLLIFWNKYVYFRIINTTRKEHSNFEYITNPEITPKKLVTLEKRHNIRKYDLHR